MLELYSNIKKQRLLKDWSQAELAKRVGYSDKSMISKIESGKIDLYQSQIQTFADAFGVSVSELMGWYDSDVDETIIPLGNAETKEAVNLYFKYLAADKKTRSIIDQLLES